MTYSLDRELQFAQMVGETGSLDGSLFLPNSSVPIHVWLDGGFLCWTLKEGEKNFASKTPQGMLDTFIKIKADDPEAVLRFAKKYGVLELCEHVLPYTHNQLSLLHRDFGNRNAGCYPVGYWDESRVAVEPLSAWFHYAAVARAVLAIAASLHQGKLGTVEEWRTALSGLVQGSALDVLAGVLSGQPIPSDAEPTMRDYILRKVEPVLRGCLQLAAVPNRWLTWAQVLPSLAWGGPAVPQPQFILMAGSTSAFGPLAVQMMMAIARWRSIYTCSGCGQPYVGGRERKPKRGQRNYCPTCRISGATGERQRVYKNRRAWALELHASGLSVEVIAQRVGSKRETVMKWVASQERGVTNG